MMDINRFNTLASLVRDARVADRAAFEEMEAAKERWRRVNETLTERQKVLDGYVAEQVAQATTREGGAS